MGIYGLTTLGKDDNDNDNKNNNTDTQTAVNFENIKVVLKKNIKDEFTEENELKFLKSPDYHIAISYKPDLDKSGN